MTTIRIEKLERPEHQGDWHDKPLKWQAVGPGSEVQKFATKADATLYARIRRKFATQQEAISLFALNF